MTHANLIAIPTQQPDAVSVEMTPLRDVVNDLLEKHQKEVTSMLRRWILFWTEFGSRSLYLDTCPIMLSGQDRKFAIEWLKEKGFSVHAPRIWGRVRIDIEDPRAG